MPIFDDPAWKPGDPVMAARLNALQQAVNRLENLRGGAGIEVRKTQGGVQITAVAQNTRYFARAAGAVTARVGTTAGTGKVDVMWVDSAGAIAKATDQPITVWNTDDARSLADQEYTWIEQDPFGTWHLIGDGLGVVRAVSTTAIPTGTSASPSSSGAAQLLALNSSGTWVNSGSPVTVWNDHTLTASIATSKVLKLCRIGGVFWLLAADC